MEKCITWEQGVGTEAAFWRGVDGNRYKDREENRVGIGTEFWRTVGRTMLRFEEQRRAGAGAVSEGRWPSPVEV